MSTKHPKSLNKLTGADLSALFEKLKEDDLIFRCNFEQIAKHFLGNFLPVNTFSTGFETLREIYVESIPANRRSAIMIGDKEIPIEDNIPDKEDAFYKYICKKYFDLVKEPKDELLKLYEKAAADMREIDETLKDISSKLEEISRRNSVDEIQEKKPIFYHYQKHNEAARAQIRHFMLHEIKTYALSQSYDNSILSGLMGRVPYNYTWNPDSYKPQMPSDLDNKFGTLTWPDFVELTKKYKQDKVSFHDYLRNYIQQEEIVFCIRELLGQHHILAKRNEIINEAVFIYEHGTKIMFASAIPTIIEGIFHDLCLLTGETENNLLQKGFQYKLDHLQQIFKWELYYEYYSFRFRIFRNKVAHGRLTNDDVSELADLLLLDLYQVCKLVFSHKLKLNQKLFLIDELSKNITAPDYKYLIQYLLLSKEALPEFYNLQSKIEEIEKLIFSDGFWGFLEDQINEGGEYIKHGIVHIVKIIATRKPFDTRCTRLLKKAGISTPDKEMVDDYIKYLTDWQ